MERESTGQWVVTLALAPGTYEYKFVVDDRRPLGAGRLGRRAEKTRP